MKKWIFSLFVYATWITWSLVKRRSYTYILMYSNFKRELSIPVLVLHQLCRLESTVVIVVASNFCIMYVCMSWSMGTTNDASVTSNLENNQLDFLAAFTIKVYFPVVYKTYELPCSWRRQCMDVFLSWVEADGNRCCQWTPMYVFSYIKHTRLQQWNEMNGV